jgi:hypothetical protein
VLDRGAQADARGATHVLDRGGQAVARGAARCALNVKGRGVKTDACGRSFAVLSTHFSALGLRLRQSRLACGTTREVSRDAAAAKEEEVGSYAAEQSKDYSICTAALGSCGNLKFHELRSLAVPSRRRIRRFERLLCRLRLWHRIPV